MKQAIAAAYNKSSLKHRAGNTQDIIQEVIQCYKECNNQVTKYAPSLQAKTVLKTCNNVWAAVHDNIRYKIDPPGFQWVRTPARLWSDKEGDCKSFSVFIGSCLHQLNIPFAFRFVSFNQDETPTHVYVVVPRQKGNEIILDAVLPQFNVEKPYTYKQDFKMPTTVTRLSGIGATAQDVANALAAEYQAKKRAGKINKLLADQYNFYYNALLQKPVAVSGDFMQSVTSIFSGGSGSGSTGGGSGSPFDPQTIIAKGGDLLQNVINLFGGSDPLKDYEGWDAQDAAAGRSKGSTVRGYILGNGDDVVREAKNIASYIQTYGLDVLLSGNPWDGRTYRENDPTKKVAADGKSWADVTVAQIADKLQRGGLTTQAQQLLNPNSYNTTGNGTDIYSGNGGMFPQNTGSNNTLLYLALAGGAAYFLFKK